MAKYSFNDHVRSDKVKWIIVTLALLVVGAILCGLMTSWFQEWNPFCWFGHDYSEENVCKRCGVDKPIDEPEAEPKAQSLVSEPFMFYASAQTLNNGISTQATLPGRPLAVGDQLANIETISFDITNFSVDQDLHCEKLFVTDDATFYFAAQDVEVTANHWVHKYRLYAQDVSSYQSFPENLEYLEYTPIDGIIEIDIRDLEHVEYYYGNTITELGTVNVYAFFTSTSLPAAPTKTGYTFTGWYTDEACTNKYTATTVTSDITLYAGFRAHTYSITFNANTGDGEMSNLSMTYDKATNLTANAFEKEHYAFIGWATEANGDVVYEDETEVKNLTAEDGATIELFAQWERSEVAINFVSEGNTTTVWIAIATSVTLPENPVKEGHNFVGWFLADGTQYTNQTLSEDTTLTAQFKIIRCTVTFIVDGEVYAIYECDWGTNLSKALNDVGVNTALVEAKGDEYSSNF